MSHGRPGRGDMSRNLGQAPSATVTTRNGVIIATRGLGDDLIAADITDLERAKAGTTPITGQREHRYLRANGDIQSAVFICNYTQTVQHGTEDCTGARRKIKNHYTQTKTRQWIGPNLGYAQTLSLKNKP